MNLIIGHSSKVEKLDEIKVDLDKLELSKIDVQGQNRDGGTVNIVAKIPVLNESSTEILNTALRTPSGKQIFGRDIGSLIPARDGEEMKQIQFYLPPNHERGEYLLEYVELYESIAGSPALYPESGSFRQTKIKLLERGIRKTINIDKEPIIDSKK